MLEQATTETPAVETGASSSTETAVSTPEVSPAVGADSWNGELSALDAQPWWSSVPEEVRTQAVPGIERIYKGWQSAHTRKAMELAEQRKAWEAERDTFERERETRRKELDDGWENYNLAILGEVDPHEHFKTDLTAKEQALVEARAELETARKELEELKASKASGEVSPASFDEERAKLLAEIEEHKKSVTEHQTRATDFETKYTAAVAEQQAIFTDAVYKWFEKSAPDVLADDEAWTIAFDMASRGENGLDLEKGVQVARAFLSQKTGAPIPEALSPHEAAMVIGSGGPEKLKSTKVQGFDDIIREQERQSGRDSRVWRPGG
jgi:hypothetical protein